MTEARRYSGRELAEITGVKYRTLRSWVQKGIIPYSLGKGGGPGKKYYTDEHLEAIRQVLRIKDQQVKMTDIPKLVSQPT